MKKSTTHALVLLGMIIVVIVIILYVNDALQSSLEQSSAPLGQQVHQAVQAR